MTQQLARKDNAYYKIFLKLENCIQAETLLKKSGLTHYSTMHTIP